MIHESSSVGRSGMRSDDLNDRCRHQAVAEQFVQAALDGDSVLDRQLPVGIFVAKHGKDLVGVVRVDVAHERSQHLVATLVRPVIDGRIIGRRQRIG